MIDREVTVHSRVVTKLCGETSALYHTPPGISITKYNRLITASAKILFDLLCMWEIYVSFVLMSESRSGFCVGCCCCGCRLHTTIPHHRRMKHYLVVAVYCNQSFVGDIEQAINGMFDKSALKMYN